MSVADAARGTRPLRRGSLVLRLALGIAAVLVAFNGYQWLRRALNPRFPSDFLVYYQGALTGRTAGWSHLYDFERQQQVLQLVAPGLAWSQEWGPFWNPPPLAWLVAPATLLPYPFAYGVWSAAMTGCLVLGWWLAAPGHGSERALHLLAFLALFPVAFCLALGQPVPLLFGSVAVACWLLRKERPVLAGLALSLVALKPHPLLLLPVALLAAGHFRAFAAAAAGIGFLALISLVSLGTDGLDQLRSDLAVASSWQQAPFTIAGLFGNGPAGWSARGAVAVAALLVAWRHRRSGPELPIAAGVVGSLAVAPFLHLQDLVLLLAAGWLMLRAEATRAQRLFAAAGWLVLEAAVAAGAAVLLLEVCWL